MNAEFIQQSVPVMTIKDVNWNTKHSIYFILFQIQLGFHHVQRQAYQVRGGGGRHSGEDLYVDILHHRQFPRGICTHSVSRLLNSKFNLKKRFLKIQFRNFFYFRNFKQSNKHSFADVITFSTVQENE